MFYVWKRQPTRHTRGDADVVDLAQSLITVFTQLRFAFTFIRHNRVFQGAIPFPARPR